MHLNTYMRQFSPAKTIFQKSLLAFLYVAAFCLSLNIYHPYDYLNEGNRSNSAYKQQSICLIPINEQDNRPTNNQVNVIPVLLLTTSSLFSSHDFPISASSLLISGCFNSTFYAQKASIIVLRRLRI